MCVCVLKFPSSPLVLSATALLALAGQADAQTLLFRDDFSTAGPDVNRTLWGGPAAGHPPLGRTFLRPATSPIAVTNGAAVLRLDTFNPGAPGSSFLGSEIATRTFYPVGAGIAFEARVQPPMAPVPQPRGLVASVFTYTIRDVGNGVLEQDEIDWEILTSLNLAEGPNPAPLPTTELWTNVYVNEFLGAGSPVQVAASQTAQLGQWNTYRIEWYPNRVRWLFNGRVVMDRTDRVPNDAMNLRMNFWAPGSEWQQAFSADLQPAGSIAQNRTFQYLVDWAMVTRLPGFADADQDGDGRFTVDDLFRVSAAPRDTNSDGQTNTDDQRAVELAHRETEVAGMAFQRPLTLVVNPSFEAGVPALGSTGPITGWTLFGNTIGNVSRNGQCPRTGGNSLKLFGQFTGGSNLSGARQAVPVRPGQNLALSVFARHPCSDRLAGANTAQVELQFLNLAGGAIGSPVTVTALTASSACDVHLPVTLSATAPAGAVSARIQLSFRQPATAAGAVHFDDLNLVITGP
jgi:hypothetical protein